MKQEMMGWQWHQLDHIHLHLGPTDNHASTSPLSFYRLDALLGPPNQQRQSTEGTYSA